MNSTTAKLMIIVSACLTGMRTVNWPSYNNEMRP